MWRSLRAAVTLIPLTVYGADTATESGNATLTAEGCLEYVLHVNAHGGGFWGSESTDRFHRCLWIARHAPPETAPRKVAIGGKHYPTVILTNHREPAMRYFDGELPRPSRMRYERIPMQAFQDTQAMWARKELSVPFHFVLPYFDTNIGNIIKNQGSMNHHQSYQMQMIAKHGDVVIDVGANLGCYTLALAESVGPSGVVLAFEPFRWLHQLLTANVAANGLMNVWTVQAGLGRAREIQWLYPPQLRFFSSPGGVKIENQTLEVERRPFMESFQLYDLKRGQEAVRVLPLDDLLLGEEGLWWGLPTPLSSIRLMKIDVEGMETAVVEGAVEVIRRYRPIIWSENNAYFDSGGKDTGFLQALARLGYFCSRAESAPTDVLCLSESGGQQL